MDLLRGRPKYPTILSPMYTLTPNLVLRKRCKCTLQAKTVCEGIFYFNSTLLPSWMASFVLNTKIPIIYIENVDMLYTF